MSEVHRIDFEAFGVPVTVEAPSAEVLARVATVLPPGCRSCGSTPEEHHFRLITRDGMSYTVAHPGESVAGSADLDVALEVLGSQLRTFIALKSPEYVFVHAGVVARDGRAILIPGPSFSGKTTLVAEFLRAGAVYLSDEFAVIDSGGLVHPYAKPLSIRTSGFGQTDHDARASGASLATRPHPIGLVLLSRYVPGAHWRPARHSSGDAALALLANTVPAQDGPKQMLATITRAVRDAPLLEGERGEALEVVQALLGERVTA